MNKIFYFEIHIIIYNVFIRLYWVIIIDNAGKVLMYFETRLIRYLLTD